MGRAQLIPTSSHLIPNWYDARRLLADLVLDPSLHVLVLAALMRPLCRCLAALLGR